MITKLTPEHQAELEATCDRWLAIGRSTNPLDRPAATKAIGDMYEAFGEERPVVLFFSSPMMCILAYGALKILSSQLSSQIRDQLRDQLWDQLSSQLWDQIMDQLSSQLWDQIRDQLRDQLSSQIRDQLRDQLSSQIRDQLWDQLWDQLSSQLSSQIRDQLSSQIRDQLWDQIRDQLSSQIRDQLSSQLWDQIRGQLWDQLSSQIRGQLSNYFAGAHWCYWEVFFDFCNRIGVRYNDDQRAKLDLWMEQSRECHWWWPYKGLVIASERYRTVSVDEQGRLHNLTGPAITYSDGWNLYAVHGLRIRPDIIEGRHFLTPAKIDAEQNVEIRRVMMEVYGQSKYLIDSGAVEMHRDDFGILYQKSVPGDEDLVMVKVVNSTCDNCQPKRCTCDAPVFKDYFIRVPPDMRTARQAVAWTFGKTEEDYAPLIET